MSKGPLVGRGSLARAWAATGIDSSAPAADEEAEIAEALGYRLREHIEAPQGSVEVTGPVISTERDAGLKVVFLEGELEDIPFWQAASFTARLEASEETKPPVRPRLVGRGERQQHMPHHKPLADWRDLAPQLRSVLLPEVESRWLDIPRTVDRLARGRRLQRMPRLHRPGWKSELTIMFDRSLHLVPYWRDQEIVSAAIVRMLPAWRISFAVWDDRGRPRLLSHGGSKAFEPAGNGATTLVLGDLGSLTSAGLAADNPWMDMGEAIRARDGRAVALTPGPAERIAQPLQQLWEVIPWEQRRRPGPLKQEERATLVERLLMLVAFAARIEPGLLRDVRHALVPEADAGIEAELLARPEVGQRNQEAVELTPDAAFSLQRAFANFDPNDAQATADRREALAIIRRWHVLGPEEVWFSEVLRLDEKSRQCLPDPEDLEDALAYVEDLAQRAGKDGDGIDEIGERAFVSRLGDVVQSHAAVWDNASFQDLIWSLRRHDLTFVPHGGAERLPSSEQPLGAAAIYQAGDRLQFAPADTESDDAGSPVAILPSDNGLFEIEGVEPTEGDLKPFWLGGEPPPWVEDCGIDKFGKWISFSVAGKNGNVSQTMRWVPPGRFEMGSLEEGAKRFFNEGPMTTITFLDGFWLFDTAVTQALWEAVMGRNPSKFEGRDRPVEQVSWDNVQKFVSELNRQIPGLELELPSEAMWEYACRARTKTPYFFGTEAREEEIQFSTKETIEVKAKPPNSWGLYQMHGNVWEWCADFWSDRHEGASPNGAPRQASKPDNRRHVIRGGSWSCDARRVRSAVRDYNELWPVEDDLGFRCARGQAGLGGRDGRTSYAVGRETEPRPDNVGGIPQQCRVIPGGPTASVKLPLAPFVIHTDRAKLILGTITKPDLGWARAMGRDPFGLWSEFTFHGVTQRLRWIPPGRFLMGSPNGEPGRFNDEGPQHEVAIFEGFWLFDTAVTQALWQAVMGNNPSRSEGTERPVERVSWHDAQAFIVRLNEADPDLSLALPSEAQWEYACRAGSETAFSFGREASRDRINFENDETVPVKSLPPNHWGLYEMHGNVWEWCADHWHNSYSEGPVADSVWLEASAEDSAVRVFRGGSWNDSARRVRSAVRHALGPESRGGDLGFRCALNSD